MIVHVLESAKEHLIEGFNFYEEQEGGLGDYFLENLFRDIDSLADYGGTHPFRSRFHFAVSRRFPFAIYYRVESGEVRVYAVLDCRRRPGLIRRKLRRAESDESAEA